MMNAGRISFSEDSLDLRQINDRPEITQQLSNLLRTIRRHLHTHPEIGFQEYETSGFIREMLEMHGLTVKGPIAETGLYVDIEGEHPGRSVGFRADIDALPIEDEKQCQYRSCRTGFGHLCGHDAHTAVAIGVALLLHQMRDRLNGRVRVLFQPNEEGYPSGAAQMIREGVLDGLESIYTVHVDPTLEVGKYGLREGPITAAADRFRIVVKGRSTGHSARPHLVVDTVWVASQILQALYQLIGRVTDARNASVLTVTRFRGGEAYNVIPAEVEFGGTLRSTDQEDRALIKRHIVKTAENIAALYHAEVEIEIEDGSPAVVNDPRLIKIARKAILDLYGEDHVYEIPRPSMGSEDFGHYLEYIPGALIRIGVSSGEETSFALHNGMFDIDEAALAPTAQLMAHVVESFLRSE